MGYMLKIKMPIKVGAIKPNMVNILLRPDHVLMHASPNRREKKMGRVGTLPIFL
jgi:hypothetical protein